MGQQELEEEQERMEEVPIVEEEEEEEGEAVEKIAGDIVVRPVQATNQ